MVSVFVNPNLSLISFLKEERNGDPKRKWLMYSQTTDGWEKQSIGTAGHVLDFVPIIAIVIVFKELKFFICLLSQKHKTKWKLVTSSKVFWVYLQMKI